MIALRQDAQRLNTIRAPFAAERPAGIAEIVNVEPERLEIDDQCVVPLSSKIPHMSLFAIEPAAATVADVPPADRAPLSFVSNWYETQRITFAVLSQTA
jgi:hypothetical protein